MYIWRNRYLIWHIEYLVHKVMGCMDSLGVCTVFPEVYLRIQVNRNKWLYFQLTGNRNLAHMDLVHTSLLQELFIHI